MKKALIFAAGALLPLTALAASAVPAPPSAAPVLKYLQQRGLKVDTRFTAVGGLIGYVGTIPDGHHIVFYTPPDGEVAIFGQLVDAYGHDLSQAYTLRYVQKPQNQANYSKLESRHWIAQGDPHPRRIIYAFIDPNCPYCWEFWKASRNVPGVQVRYLMVAILGQSSSGKAAAILSAKDPAQALTENESGFQHHEGAIKPLASVPESLKKELLANDALMQSFGFNGTPGLIWKTESGEVQTSNGLPGDAQLKSMFGKAPAAPQTQTLGDTPQKNP